MWYKEWRQARFKILAATASYGLIGLYTIIAWLTSGPGSGYSSYTLLDSWLTPAAIATGALAALGGIDAVSEEKDRGTLSFLLTRPLKRTHVYSVKLLVNLGWLTVIYTAFSLVIFGLSRIQLSQTQAYIDNYRATYDSHAIFASDLAPLWPLNQSITVMLLILMFGIAITCYTAFISIFARSAVETIVYSVLIAMSVAISIFIVIAIVKIAFYRELQVPEWLPRPQGMLLESIALAVLALIFYRVGRAVFSRKEF